MCVCGCGYVCACLLQDFMSTSCTGQVFKAWVNELPFSPLTSDNFQLLLEILEGYRPQVTSVVTSRPWAVQQLLENFESSIFV